MKSDAHKTRLKRPNRSYTVKFNWYTATRARLSVKISQFSVFYEVGPMNACHLYKKSCLTVDDLLTKSRVRMCYISNKTCGWLWGKILFKKSWLPYYICNTLKEALKLLTKRLVLLMYKNLYYYLYFVQKRHIYPLWQIPGTGNLLFLRARGWGYRPTETNLQGHARGDGNSWNWTIHNCGCELYICLSREIYF